MTTGPMASCSPASGGQAAVRHGHAGAAAPHGARRPDGARLPQLLPRLGCRNREAADIAEAALAHVVGDKTAAYQRGDLLERRRRLMDAWAAFCGRPVSGRRGGCGTARGAGVCVMTEPSVADPPSGKVPPEWQKRGTWLSKAWETHGTPSHVEQARRAERRYSELCEGETPEMHLMCSRVEFPQWRKARRSPHDEVRAAWREYCINREAAEMAVDRQLLFGSLSAFGAPRHRGADPEWIPTQAWYGLHRDLDQHDVVRGEGIVYFYVRVIDAEQWLLAAGHAPPHVSNRLGAATQDEATQSCRASISGPMTLTFPHLKESWRHSLPVAMQ